MKTKCIVSMVVVMFALVDMSEADIELLVTSRNTNNVLRYDGATGGFIDEFIPSGSGGLHSPGGIAFGPDGNVYVASHETGMATVKQYNSATGNYVGDFTSPQPHFPYIHMLFGVEGHLYAASEDGASNVYRYNGHTGAFLGDFLSGGDDRGIGIAFGPDENLYVSNYLSDAIDCYDGLTGEFIGAFASELNSNGLSFPMGITFGPDDNLYICGWHSQSIFRYNGTTGEFIDEFVLSGSGGLLAPSNLIFGPDENLYVCDFSGDCVLRYDGISGDFLDVFATGNLEDPFDLVFIPEPCSFSIFTLSAVFFLRRKFV